MKPATEGRFPIMNRSDRKHVFNTKPPVLRLPQHSGEAPKQPKSVDDLPDVQRICYCQRKAITNFE